MNNRHARQDKGMTLAIVLVCLLIVLMLGVTLTQMQVMRHRNARTLEDQQQCFWLAEAGVQRAVDTLAGSPEYTGETWEIPADLLGGPFPGRVVINVSPTAELQPGRRLKVEARYPDRPVQYQVYVRELFVNSTSPGG